MARRSYTTLSFYLLWSLLIVCYTGKAQQRDNFLAKTNRALRSGNQEQLSIGLYFTLNGADRIADGVTVIYNNAYSAGIDGNDAEQITNFDEDLAISRNGKFLSIEGRPLIDDRDTIYLTIARMRQMTYQLRFTPASFNSPLFQAYLQDNFTGGETEISLIEETNVIFSVTSNAASSASNRFRVVYRYPREYISNGPVNVSSATNWLYYNGTNYIPASVPPTNNNVSIQAGHSFHVDQSFTVEAGKAFYLESTSQIIIDPNTVFTISGIGNLNGQSVTIKSEASGTGSIGTIIGTVLGATNVTVERFVPALNRKAYRLLNPSVNTTGSLKPFILQNWQENKTFTAGLGTHITGSPSGANGFDATITGNPSMYTYTYGGANPDSYTPILNTDATVLDAKTGYLLFVRGDRTLSHIQSAATSSNTTLRTTGSLVFGDVSYSIQGDGKFTLVTNPYPSSISWSSIFTNGSTAIENFYTYLDPKIGNRGGYVTVTNTGETNFAVNGTINIQSGQAFFVKSTSSGTHALTIKEAHKSTTNNVNVFRTGSQEHLSIGLYFALNGGKRVADGVNILFNNSYAAAVDGNDAEQITNFDEDISVKRGGKFLSIEGRPMIDETDTIFLNMTHMKEKEYTYEFNPASFNAPGMQAYLQDNFTGNETQISLAEQTIVPFTVSGNSASAASDRFKVVFRNNTVLPINFTNVKAFEKGSNIQVEWNLGNEQNVKKYEVEKSVDGRTFSKKGMQAARTISSTDNYQWLDVAPNMGNNYYRIKAIENGGSYKYSQVVNVKTGKSNSSYVVYPNPVKDRTINLQLVNQPKGKFSIKLINQLGQEVYRKELNHIGGSSSETLQVTGHIAAGIYALKIDNGSNKKVLSVVVE